MKLWVDDIRKAPDDTWNVARTATVAIRAIARYDFDVISLDHDISHFEVLDETNVEQDVRACEETFAAVAYYIAMKYIAIKSNQHVAMPWEPKIILHTSNQTAGDEMALVLKEGGLSCEKAYIGAV